MHLQTLELLMTVANMLHPAQHSMSVCFDWTRQQAHHTQIRNRKTSDLSDIFMEIVKVHENTLQTSRTPSNMSWILLMFTLRVQLGTVKIAASAWVHIQSIPWQLEVSAVQKPSSG